jgi:ubiquinone/menaquinone biosynthesis C-methylase UbiE
MSDRAPVTTEDWERRTCKNWIDQAFSTAALDHPHRKGLIERICRTNPKTVLELGCGVGVNLLLVAEKLRDANLVGVDINPQIIERGKQEFKSRGFENVDLEVGRVQNLDKFGAGSFDVALTDAVLIYIEPEEIGSVVEGMLRVAKRLVLFEWHVFSIWRPMMKHLYLKRRFRFDIKRGLFVGHWVRDYRKLFEDYVPQDKVSVTRMDKQAWNDRNWQSYGATIEVENVKTGA